VTTSATNGSSALTVTGAFTATQDGWYIVNPAGGYFTGMPQRARLTYVDATHATLTTTARAATNATSTWNNVSMLLAPPLPAGADLATLAAAIKTAALKFRYFYDATADPIIDPTTVTALMTAAGGTAVPINGGGHTNATAASVLAYNGGSYGDDVLSYLLTADKAA
jgi:hypothetical protein